MKIVNIMLIILLLDNSSFCGNILKLDGVDEFNLFADKTERIGYIVVPEGYYMDLRAGNMISQPISFRIRAIFETVGGACYALRIDEERPEITRYMTDDPENIPNLYDKERSTNTIICFKRNTINIQKIVWDFELPLIPEICSKDNENRLFVSLYTEEIGSNQLNRSNKLSFCIFKSKCAINPIIKMEPGIVPKLQLEIETNTDLEMKVNGIDEENIDFISSQSGEKIQLDSLSKDFGQFTTITTNSYMFKTLHNENKFLIAVKIIPRFYDKTINEKVHVDNKYFTYEIKRSQNQMDYDKIIDIVNPSQTDPSVQIPNKKIPIKIQPVTLQEQNINAEKEFFSQLSKLLRKNKLNYKDTLGIEVKFNKGDNLSNITTPINRLISTQFSHIFDSIFYSDVVNYNYKLGNEYIHSMKKYKTKRGPDFILISDIGAFICLKEIKEGDKLIIPFKYGGRKQ